MIRVGCCSYGFVLRRSSSNARSHSRGAFHGKGAFFGTTPGRGAISLTTAQHKMSAPYWDIGSFTFLQWKRVNVHCLSFSKSMFGAHIST